MTGKTIGEAAREFGLNPRTLRYLWGRSISCPPPRVQEGGYRIYDEEAARRLDFILKAKHLGLTLKEIQQIVAARDDGLPCDSVKRLLREHLKRIDQQMVQLRR
jgi:DNA-binding transcriptional MerR regulator